MVEQTIDEAPGEFPEEPQEVRSIGDTLISIFQKENALVLFGSGMLIVVWILSNFVESDTIDTIGIMSPVVAIFILPLNAAWKKALATFEEREKWFKKVIEFWKKKYLGVSNKNMEYEIRLKIISPDQYAEMQRELVDEGHPYGDAPEIPGLAETIAAVVVDNLAKLGLDRGTVEKIIELIPGVDVPDAPETGGDQEVLGIVVGPEQGGDEPAVTYFDSGEPETPVVVDYEPIPGDPA